MERLKGGGEVTESACAAQILKQDWPSKWPTFITDIVNASKTSELLCENSMVILKLLSEEIFDFSRGELTTVSQQFPARLLHSPRSQASSADNLYKHFLVWAQGLYSSPPEDQHGFGISQAS